MKIKSVLEYMQWNEKMPDFDMYRGHLNTDWLLLPSIVRYAEQIPGGYDSIAEIERHLIKWFEKYSTPFKDYRLVSYLEKLVDSQHYGLPTRLLDWTTNPLKALYFAVENPEFDNVDGIVYGFAPKFWCEGIKHVKLDNTLGAFYPELLNERLSAQEGCFTAFPLPKKGFRVLPISIQNYPKEISSLYKIVVDAKSKKSIRFELNKLGINHRTIYPGLEGVAKWIKSDLSNYIV